MILWPLATTSLEVLSSLSRDLYGETTHVTGLLSGEDTLPTTSEALRNSVVWSSPQTSGRKDQLAAGCSTVVVLWA